MYHVSMIEYKDVTKVFPDGTEAIKRVNFSVDPAEFMFLCGPSGAGKTTLLRFLIREDFPTEGEIFFEDKNILELPRSMVPKLRRNIGMVFQDFKLLPHLNVYENVALALEVIGSSDEKVSEIVPFLLEQIGLSERMENFPQQLSSGEAQRVAIARALVHEPKVLLADEPTGNLDYENSWQIVRLLQQINEWGTTVLMATHDTEIVKALKKRVVKIDKGEIVEDS